MRTIRVDEPRAGLLVVTLDRPEVRNALNTEMARELREVFVPLGSAPASLRCVVMTGAGDKAFCAGADLKERRGMADGEWRAQHALFEEAGGALLACAVPVIAAVNGAAYAGGCELAMAADFIHASRTARFALTEVTLGIMPGLGGTQFLPRAVGERRAKELVFSGTPFSADEALEWGLVNAVHDPDKLMPAVMAIAERILANAPISVRQVKKAIARGLQMDLASGLAFEQQAYERVVGTEDRREGIEAFNQKRKPGFKGR